jgi:Flp pilus assembly protein TadG
VPFWSDQRGATAVEMALVLPVLTMVLLGIVEFGALFYLNNAMSHVAKDVARRVAVGELTDNEAVDLIQERLSSWNADFTASVAHPGGTDVETMISVPLADAAIINFFDHFFGDGNLTSRAIMRTE